MALSMKQDEAPGPLRIPLPRLWPPKPSQSHPTNLIQQARPLRLRYRSNHLYGHGSPPSENWGLQGICTDVHCRGKGELRILLPLLTAQTTLGVLNRDMSRRLAMARTALLERAGAL